MRRLLAALALGGLLVLPVALPASASSPATSPVHASSNGQGLITVTAPASATAWRVRAGRDGRYLLVVVERSGPGWTGYLRWEHRTRTGLHVDRTMSLTSFLRQKAQALGGCDMVIGLCAVTFDLHLPTRTAPDFRFFFANTNGGGQVFSAIGGAWLPSHGHHAWVYSSAFTL